MAEEKDTATSLMGEWRAMLTRAADESEKLAKERPIVALVVAFVLGMIFNAILGAFFRGRRK